MSQNNIPSKNQSNSKPKIIAYLRISTQEQDLNSQKLELHEYAHKNNFKIDEFIETEI